MTSPRNRILIGDAVECVKTLPTDSIDTVITSPPYWALRNYQVEGQLGLESDVHVWVERLSELLDDIARVLKPEGSVWLNLGDTYSRHQSHGALPKSLVLAPERLLLRLAAQGWIVRSKVVWAKQNPMPTSVRDRLATTWEPIYLLVRSLRGTH